MGRIRKCTARCHRAKGTRCRCWCGGAFHGADGSGAANREALAQGRTELLEQHGFKTGETAYIEQRRLPLGELKEMPVKTYRLYHRIRKEFREVDAESAQEACQAVGWYIADTWVREYTLVISDPSKESGHRGGGWKNVTKREERLPCIKNETCPKTRR